MSARTSHDADAHSSNLIVYECEGQWNNDTCIMSFQQETREQLGYTESETPVPKYICGLPGCSVRGHRFEHMK